jgi:hypothetical protein
VQSYTGQSEDFTAGGYRYLVFNGSGSITISTGGNIDVFAIGGGGGGGGTLNNSGPGGDAGQSVYGKFPISAGSYTITIGAGGIASDGWNSNSATAGGDTVISSFLTAAGGKPAYNTACCPGASQYETVKLGSGRGTNGTGISPQTGGGGILSFMPTSSNSENFRTFGIAHGHYFLDNTPPHEASNTGNGGWGVWSNANRRGGNGGSGVVIIKYQYTYV